MSRSASVAARSITALPDLTAAGGWAADHGWYLLLHDSVADDFDIPPEQLPAGVVDGAGTDAVGRAVGDPSAILVVVAGFWVIRDRDPRERQLPVRAELVISRLSGGYYGLKVTGVGDPQFRGGALDVIEEVDAALVASGGVTASVVRTTAGWATVTGGRTILARSRQEAYRRLLDGGASFHGFHRDRLRDRRSPRDGRGTATMWVDRRAGSWSPSS